MVKLYIAANNNRVVFWHIVSVHLKKFMLESKDISTILEEVMINQLVKGIKEKDAPIVVGLDPMLSYVPEHLVKDAFAAYGETLEGACEAIWQFNKGIIDATYDLIPAVKPQVAMYEQFGVEGMKAFKKTCDYAKSKGLVIIGDIKRGDIGSTSEAYAIGHVGTVKIGEQLLHLQKTL